MSNYVLKAQKRVVFGRKVKKLRQEGILPANLFGKKIKSQAVSVNSKEFTKVFSQAGESSLVDLELDGKKTPVLISNVSLHPVSSNPVHADLHQVDLKEKVTAHVPLEIIGEAPAVKDKIGVLLKNLDEIQVEALPKDLPEKIELDISNLKAIDEAIKVNQLSVAAGIKILADAELELVKIAPLVSKEAEKMAEEQAAQAAAQSAPAEAETEAKSEESVKPEEAKKHENQKKES